MRSWSMYLICCLTRSPDSAELETSGGLSGVEFEVDVVTCESSAITRGMKRDEAGRTGSGGEDGRVDEGCNNMQRLGDQIRCGKTFIQATRYQPASYARERSATYLVTRGALISSLASNRGRRLLERSRIVRVCKCFLVEWRPDVPSFPRNISLASFLYRTEQVKAA